MNTRPLLSFYGDDFTGSTDVMEALASNGVPTVLFMDIPDEALLARFSECRAVGIAGTSRSETPAWMQDHLQPIFQWLKKLDAEYCHYKVCSTFDSSPITGNIGKAIEVGKAVYRQKYVPLVVGAPQLKRYTAFAHLFADYRGETYRIDRHPVMSRHPVTPMDESDLRLHLAKQTTLKTDLIDLAVLQSPDATKRINNIAEACDGVLFFDVANQQSQRHTGDALARLKTANGWFVAGSSGVEYALLAHWRGAGHITGRSDFPSPGPAKRIAVVSGSVSPTTARQIRYASENGFEGIPVNPLSLVGEDATVTMNEVTAAAVRILKEGRSPLVYTALGPAQDIGVDIDRIVGARHKIGQTLGRILRELIERENLARVVIAGGDTSSHALRELGTQALTTLLPLPATPGSPLCLGHSSAKAANGVQIALKGGQVGKDDYFAMIRAGG